MIEEIGVVTSIHGSTANVSVPKKSACEGCTSGICSTAGESMEITAFNKAGAKVGQTVKVLVSSYAYMKGSMIIYGIPALSLVLGAVFGKEFISRIFVHTDADVLSAVSGFSFLALSFVAVKIWSDRLPSKTESSPVVEEILG